MIFAAGKYIPVKLVARIPRDYYFDKWKAHAGCRVFIILVGHFRNDV